MREKLFQACEWCYNNPYEEKEVLFYWGSVTIQYYPSEYRHVPDMFSAVIDIDYEEELIYVEGYTVDKFIDNIIKARWGNG